MLYGAQLYGFMSGAGASRLSEAVPMTLEAAEWHDVGLSLYSASADGVFSSPSLQKPEEHGPPVHVVQHP